MAHYNNEYINVAIVTTATQNSDICKKHVSNFYSRISVPGISLGENEEYGEVLDVGDVLRRLLRPVDATQHNRRDFGFQRNHVDNFITRRIGDKLRSI